MARVLHNMVAICLIFAFNCVAIPSVPYLKAEQPTSQLKVIAETGRSDAELLALDTLAGNLARRYTDRHPTKHIHSTLHVHKCFKICMNAPTCFRSPRMYRVLHSNWTEDMGSDPYAMWLQDLTQRYHITTDNSLISAPLSNITLHFKDELVGYVRCGTDVHSIAAAISFAAAGVGIVVASDAHTSAAFDTAGLPLLRNFSKYRLSYLLEDLLPNLTSRVLIFQDQGKNKFLGDYAVFARAGTMAYNSDMIAQTALLRHAQRGGDLGVCFGWGPENDYVSDCNKHGPCMHQRVLLSDTTTELSHISLSQPCTCLSICPHALQACTCMPPTTIRTFPPCPMCLLPSHPLDPVWPRPRLHPRQCTR